MEGADTPRSLREKQRQEREQLIVQVAEDVLMEKGYHDMSMDEIATRVGIAKGTLYLHFAKKEDLVLALLESEMQGVLASIEQAKAMPSSTRDKLAFILRSMYEGMLGKRGRLFNLLLSTVELRMMLKERHGKLFFEVVSCISGLLDEGKAQGEFDSSIPTEVMLGSFFCIAPSRVYKEILTEKKIVLNDLINYLETIYFRGIAAQ